MPNSQFDKMTKSSDASAVEYEEQEYAPQVIFTNDAKPDLSKLQINRLRLAQGMTQEVAERRASIGQYVLSNFPPYDEVELVPLIAQNTRQYKPDPKAPPQCVAPTGDFGLGNPGGPCIECPLSKWGPRNEKTGKATPPLCKEAVVIRAYSLTHRTVVDMQFTGRVANRGATIQSQALALGYGNFVVRLKSTSTKNDRGQWYEPEIEIAGDVPADQKEIVNRWYDAVMSQTVSSAQARQEVTRKQLPG